MKRSGLFLIIFVLACGAARAQPSAITFQGKLTDGTSSQPTAFTYQGKLTDGGTAANGTYDFQFSLYDAANMPVTGGTINGVLVTNGVFTLNLDFGATVFTSNNPARFLEIGVRLGGGGGYTTLTPRQAITSAPFSVKALSAASADSFAGVVPVANGGTGSATQNFVDLSTTQTVGGSKAFSSGSLSLNNGSSNSIGFAPFGVGPPSPTSAGWKLKLFGDYAYGIGVDDFTQWYAAQSNHRWYSVDEEGTATQRLNLDESGNLNVGGTGTANLFNSTTQYNIGGARVLGVSSGIFGDNTFLGINAGTNNAAWSNSFFGSEAGRDTNSGASNSFFGEKAGQQNTGGANNSFFGAKAGQSNTGGGNSFVGSIAGNTNTIGNRNTLIGYYADVSAGNLEYATAIGAESRVSTSNTIALGRLGGFDTVRIYGNLIVDGTTSFSGRQSIEMKAVRKQQSQIDAQQDRSDKQNAQIEAQQKQLQQHQLVINELKQIVCTLKPGASICKEINK